MTREFAPTTLQGIAAVFDEAYAWSKLCQIAQLNSLPIIAKPSNKRESLALWLVEQQKCAQNNSAARLFIEAAANPLQFQTLNNGMMEWQELQEKLNRALAFEGLALNASGKIVSIETAAKSMEDAELLAAPLRAELERRDCHQRLLEYCSEELVAKSLFHAMSEAAKSIPDTIRSIVDSSLDGAELYDYVFGGEEPLLKINSYESKSEQSEQKGFVNLLKGIHGLFRNPRAHAPRLGFEENRQDFFDAFSLFSYVHRKLDGIEVSD